jgi:RNA polymerase sigma-70 factor (ECF subfamily)
LQFFLAGRSKVALWAYLGGVRITSSQPVEDSAVAGIDEMPKVAQLPVQPNQLLNELWRESGGAAYGLEQEEFSRILESVGKAQNYGLAAGATASQRQQTGFLRGLRLADLVLAQACAVGHEGAWEHFIEIYRQPLFRAAIAITGSETLGRELADHLYAELYGLKASEGVRRSPLDSYKGKGSLMGWLRTTLAQRHVDHHRRTRRELPLDNLVEGHEPPAADPKPGKLPAELLLLAKAVVDALEKIETVERFLLAAYYIDGRTLLEIAPVLHVHEATVSRKLHRLVNGIRKQIVKNLLEYGLNKQAVQEMLGTDPRDLDLNLKKILQVSLTDAFNEKAAL